MHRRWLSWTLLSTTVSAFYPYFPPNETDAKEKRFFPIESEDEPEERTVFTLDIKKVQRDKRDNTFPVVLSSKPDLPNGLAIDEDGQDFSYFSVMRFGAQKQPMYMLIDTGSANTWVFDSTCPSSACLSHNTFGQSNSNTLNITTDTWSLTYGTGEVTGVVARDTVAFANYSLELGFGLAQTASDDFNYYPMDGILGLGRQSSDVLGVPTLMDKLDSQNLLRLNIIGVHLQRNSSGDKDGQITFGDVDKTKFDGEINYIGSLADDLNWEVPVDDVGVDGTNCQFIGKSAIIDTGTSYILMPLQDALALHQLIPGAAHTGENFVIPCDANSKVQFTFSGVTYNIGPEDYLGTASGSMCASNIIGHQAFGPNQWILGDVFLKNVYTVFDFDKDRIGFGTSSISMTAPTSSYASSSKPTTSTKPTATVHTSLAAPTMSMKTTTAKAQHSSAAVSTRASSTTSSSTAATSTINSSPFGDTQSAASNSHASIWTAMTAAFLFVLVL